MNTAKSRSETAINPVEPSRVHAQICVARTKMMMEIIGQDKVIVIF